MSFEYPKNTKIFRNPADLSSSIFNILEKKLTAELNDIHFEDHLIRNLYHLPSTTDTDIFKLKGSIFFNIADRIRTNDISVLGYTKGRPCQLTYELNYDFLTNELPNTQPDQYKITGFIAEVYGMFTDDGYCKEINLCIDIPREGNSNIGYFGYTLKENNSFAIYTFRCLPYNLHKYRSVNELNNEFTSLWKSPHGESLIEQFITDVTLSRIPIIFDNQTTYCKNLNPSQKKLVNLILSENHIITCNGYGGTGKTHTACAAIDEGVCFGKRFLVIAPTYRSVETFMKTLKKYNLCEAKLLCVTPASENISITNPIEYSEAYYFLKGLKEYEKQFFSPYSYERLTQYSKCMKKYTATLSTSARYWECHDAKIATEMIQQLSTLEDMLRNMINDYVNPNVIITTTDLVLAGKIDKYEMSGFDYIFMDDASHISTTTALIILSKFHNSKVCYLGDLQQLPPLSLHNLNLTEKDLPLYTSIIDLMKINKQSIQIDLCVNYRSRPEIVKLCNGLFYHGLLEPMLTQDRHQDEIIKFGFVPERSFVLYGPQSDIPLIKKPYYLLDIPFNTHNTSSTSPYDIQEATAITILLLRLFEQNLPHNDIWCNLPL